MDHGHDTQEWIDSLSFQLWVAPVQLAIGIGLLLGNVGWFYAYQFKSHALFRYRHSCTIMPSVLGEIPGFLAPL
ncbi:hypothetical protein BYT27DRAFT_7204930 [Phlegmacium glaucopus]|nr:hypothetical protein BYT27DRAFT_7204930 [Phlegmacium glaucopus]